jgi:hypothetical protein
MLSPLLFALANVAVVTITACIANNTANTHPSLVVSLSLSLSLVVVSLNKREFCFCFCFYGCTRIPIMGRSIEREKKEKSENYCEHMNLTYYCTTRRMMFVFVCDMTVQLFIIIAQAPCSP